MDRISIATINFNGAEKTIILLDSLKNQSVKDFQMIVVDNNSDKYDYARLENWILNNSPDVFLFKNAVNSGFAGGSNYGINKALKAGADWVVLLNNDTWVESDFIERLKPELEHKEGIIGLPLDEGDGHISFGGCLQWLKPTLTHGHGYVKGEKTTVWRQLRGAGNAARRVDACQERRQTVADQLRDRLFVNGAGDDAAHASCGISAVHGSARRQSLHLSAGRSVQRR